MLLLVGFWFCEAARCSTGLFFFKNLLSFSLISLTETILFIDGGGIIDLSIVRRCPTLKLKCGGTLFPKTGLGGTIVLWYTTVEF